MQKLTPREIIPHVVRLDEDLMESLQSFASANGLFAGRFSGTGLLKTAALGFFNQVDKELTTLKMNKMVELVSIKGDISEKNGVPVISGKIIVADQDRKLSGGALQPGSKVFTAEIFIEVFDGGPLKRSFDPSTGLSVWSEE
ncbi:MAG: DUF296 domain-containing protein [Bacteroidetes bacterium]|nr:DUF296 domain-containing protein [Bacteroidota bacterium]